MVQCHVVVCVVQHLLLCLLSVSALDNRNSDIGSHANLRQNTASRKESVQSVQLLGGMPVHSPTRHDHGSAIHELVDALLYNPGNKDQDLQHALNSRRNNPHHVKSSTHPIRNLKSAPISTVGSKIKHGRLRRRETPLSANDVILPVDKKITSAGRTLPSGDEILSQEDALELVKEQRDRPREGECDDPEKVLELSKQFPSSWTTAFKNQSQLAINTANVLNNLFRAWDSQPTSLYNDAFFYSLAKGFLSGDGTVAGASIAFDRDQYLIQPPSPDASPSPGTFAPYIKREKPNKETFHSLDIADLTKGKYTANGTAGYEWFWKQRKQFSELWDNRSLCDKVNPEKLADSFSSVSGVTTTDSQGQWTEPYYDCKRTKQWVVTFSVPFFGCNKLDQMLFKGVVAIDVALSRLDINQCETLPEEGAHNLPHNAFAGTHKCRKTTHCIFTSGYGFHLGGYNCICDDHYYFPTHNVTNSKQDDFYRGRDTEDAHSRKILNDLQTYEVAFQCLPCGKGCGPVCRDNTSCYVDYNVMIRRISVGVVSFCMSVCLVLAIVVIRMRKTKVMKASVWILLEIILLGSIFLYCTVIIQYFEPSDVTCLMIPWFREVGFAIVYGAIVLKIYRILSEFQSRKAHRVHVRDKDLLKYTLTIVVIVVGFMAAWSAVNLDYILLDGASLITHAYLQDGLTFEMCRAMWWDYVIEVGEFLLLVFGIYLCYRIRSAPSDYMERRYLSLAIYNETIVSTLTHIIRHSLWGIIHPDYIFLMYFVRCQLTVSLCVALVLGPKLWYAHRPPEEDHFRNRTYSSSDVQDNVLPESMKLHAGVNSNGDVDVTEINLSEMDPEDIRAELKRLYTQLQIYKTKTMRKDNPHISKRRGGRKQTHRRFSLQAFHHKHRHHHDHDHDHEMSKTPEESTNSAEGVAYSIEESTCSVGDMSDRRTPTVTFKPGHKSFY